MIFDMHVHTSLSPCSGMDVDEAVMCAKERGLDGICITDHNTMDVRHTLSEGLQENGICVIFGMEYSTSQGDFLVFGPFEGLAHDLPAHQLLQTVEKNGGIAVAAHPFRRNRPVNEQIIQEGLCSAIESFNGRNTLTENLAAERWRRCYDLLECGGSDAHTIEEVGTFATRFFVPIQTRSDLITALKKRQCQPEIPGFAQPCAYAPHQNPN
ncbi:MAG: PHP domain-containing protein [Desulfobacterales bacterium]